MNTAILNFDVQDYINSHLKTDPAILILKGVPFTDVTVQEAVEQLEAKTRCQTKLPTWFSQTNIYYPNKRNIEQTSSEITAEYKASLVQGASIIDLAGGLGIDSFYFSKRFKSVVHCEINESLSHIVSHNYKQLNIENIETLAIDGLEYLKSSGKHYDWIYVDPSRRHDIKGKVFFLKDCLPNIPDELDTLFKHSDRVLIKTSPLLDISAGIEELKYVKTIHVVAVDNEVKELLWILENHYDSEITIETINLKPERNENFKFGFLEESKSTVTYNRPLTYLYEPNSAILKSGGFNSVALKLEVFKLHKHTHLYTSEQLIEFPGRRFKINDSMPYHKKKLKHLKIQKANITTRNFPETVQKIRHAFKINDGGPSYIFFTTNMIDEKIVLFCTKAI